MLKSKRTIGVIIGLVLILGLSVSAAPSAASDWVFTRPIEIMIPASLGGGLDTTLRAFQPFLERELGTSIVIDNRSGGSGATGFTYLYSLPRDGYSFAFSSPSFIGPVVQGLFTVPLWESLIPMINLVKAEAMIFANPNAPFSNLEEMVEYVKANPGRVTISIDTPMGISGACFRAFAGQLGLEMRIIPSESDESIISVIAGDIHTNLDTWTEAGVYVESGDLIAIATLTEGQSVIVPDVPSSATVGAPVSLGFFRYFLALEGTPQGAIDAFVAAVQRASQDEEWIAWLYDNGLCNNYVFGADRLREFLDETYIAFAEIFLQ